MKGGRGPRRRSVRLTDWTRNFSRRIAFLCARAAASSGISILPPSRRTSVAAKVGGVGAASATWMRQNSLATKALISASRSTTMRTATDCTRPAESPRLTLFQSSGLIW